MGDNMLDTRRAKIRKLVDIYYNVQKVRVSTDNQLREVGQNVQKAMKKEELNTQHFQEIETALNKYIEENLDPSHLKELENQIKQKLEPELQHVRIYTEFLADIKGIGPTLAGGLVSRLDPHEAPYISSFWKYCGLHVKNGKAAGREKGSKVEYNPFMKDHLWKVGDQFIKQRTPKYREIYDERKEKENNKLNQPLEFPHEGSKLSTNGPSMKKEDIVELAQTKGIEDVSDMTKIELAKAIRRENAKDCPMYEECVEDINAKADRADREPKVPPCAYHIDQRARRVMEKEFLKDLWIRWRKIEGLKVRESYHQAIQDSKQEA